MFNQNLVEQLIQNYTGNLGRLSQEQLGEDLFLLWTHKFTDLYRAAESLSQNKKWRYIEELEDIYGFKAFKDILLDLLEMIGLKNNLPFYLHSDLFALVISYTIIRQSDRWSGLEKDNHEIKWHFFRRRTENLFARILIEEQMKYPKMKSDDEQDFRLLRHLKDKHKGPQVFDPSPSIKTDKSSSKEKSHQQVKFTSFVVTTNIFRCNKNHKLESVIAVVDILRQDGSVVQESIPASYCKDCKIYFILEPDYKAARFKGVLLCQLISQEKYEKEYATLMESSNFKAESLLHRCGYNVNSIDNLSALQRHEILRRVLANGLYSKAGLLSFLDWLINQNTNKKTKDMSSAVQKWKDDRAFISLFASDSDRKVKIDRIIYRR